MTEEHIPLTPPVPPAPDAPVVPRPQVPSPPVVEEAVQISPSWESEPVADDRRPKSPVAAAILAAVPFGLGHLYLGQYSRALAFFAAFWAPMIFLQLPLIAVFFYFFAIFDAYRQAQLINLAAEEGIDPPAGAFHGGITAGVFLIVLGAVLLLRNWIDFWSIREFLRDWWPAFLVVVGAWFVYGALKERADARREAEGFDLE